MDIGKIVGLAIITVLFGILLKNNKPEIALLMQIAAGVLILLVVASKIAIISGVLSNLASKFNFNSSFLNILLKIVGIAYIAEFGMGLCKDADQNALAKKVELAAKILILVVSIPILVGLTNTMAKILK